MAGVIAFWIGSLAIMGFCVVVLYTASEGPIRRQLDALGGPIRVWTVMAGIISVFILVETLIIHRV
jgi:hypothetical protein